MKNCLAAFVALLAIVACSAKKVDLDKALKEQEEEDEAEELAWRSKKAFEPPSAGLPVDMTFDEDGKINVADGVDLKEHLTKLAQGESHKFSPGGADLSGGLKILEVDIVPAHCAEQRCCKELADKYSRLLHTGGVANLQHDVAAPYCKITYFFTGDKLKLKTQVHIIRTALVASPHSHISEVHDSRVYLSQ
jgi:hypothetical protein